MQFKLEVELYESFKIKRITPSLQIAVNQAAMADVWENSSVKKYIRTCFDMAKSALDSAEASTTMYWLEECVILFNNTVHKPVYKAEFAPADDIRSTVLQYLSNTVFAFDLCMYTLSDDYLSDEILRLHDNGIAVRIICDDSKSFDAGTDVRRLAKAGIPVKTDGHPELMHHKFAVIDEKIVLNGSYNWTRTAAERNYENLIFIENQQLAKTFSHEFDRLWNMFAPIEKLRFDR